ncbi:MAG: hypothetical protein ACSHXI_16905 [Hoeflea sp.]|uniref:hypothetical protein n=1 Tax=Hoeflea sp. TaxID=1940281 RepID=UPI003EF8C21F
MERWQHQQFPSLPPPVAIASIHGPELLLALMADAGLHPFGFIARDLPDCPSKRIAQINDSIVVLALRLHFAKHRDKVSM